jgi:hypothetical protein
MGNRSDRLSRSLIAQHRQKKLSERREHLLRSNRAKRLPLPQRSVYSARAFSHGHAGIVQ